MGIPKCFNNKLEYLKFKKEHQEFADQLSKHVRAITAETTKCVPSLDNSFVQESDMLRFAHIHEGPFNV